MKMGNKSKFIHTKKMVKENRVQYMASKKSRGWVNSPKFALKKVTCEFCKKVVYTRGDGRNTCAVWGCAIKKKVTNPHAFRKRTCRHTRNTNKSRLKKRA